MVGLIAVGAAAVLVLGWRRRRLYLALFEDAEVPRRQIEQLSRRRDALTVRLEETRTPRPGAALQAPAASEMASEEAPSAVESVRAELDDVIHRLAAAERIRALTLVAYARRVPPLLARCLWLPRPHR
jgi:hypothetical protein